MSNDWINELDRPAEEEPQDSELEALGIVPRREAAVLKIERKASVRATFDDGSQLEGVVQAQSPDGATFRVAFADGGAQWFAEEQLRVIPPDELSGLDAVFARTANAEQPEALGQTLIGEGVARTVIEVPRGCEGSLKLAQRIAGFEHAFDAEPTGPGRTAVYGYVENPKSLSGGFDKPGLLENEGASGMGRDADGAEVDEPSDVRADGDEIERPEAEEAPSETDDLVERLRALADEIYEMTRDSWANVGLEAGEGTCDRVASILIGSGLSRQAQYAPLRDMRNPARGRQHVVTGNQKASNAPLVEAADSAQVDDLASVLAMSKEIPSEAPAVHKLIVDYLAANPAALDSLAPGAYMQALRSAVDFWRQTNPQKLERVRKKVAPDITESVTGRQEPVAGGQEPEAEKGPASWWTRAKRALTRGGQEDGQTAVTEANIPPGTPIIQGQPLGPDADQTRLEPTHVGPGRVKTQVGQVPGVVADRGLKLPSWAQEPDARGLDPTLTMPPRTPVPTGPRTSPGIGGVVEEDDPVIFPIPEDLRGRQVPVRDKPVVFPKGGLRDLVEEWRDPRRGPARSLRGTRGDSPRGRAPGTRQPSAQTEVGGPKTWADQPKRAAAGLTASTRRVAQATPEVVGEIARRLAASQPVFRFPDKDWDIKVKNATSTGHWLLLDVEWPEEGCPVNAKAPGGPMSMSFLVQGRAHGWMQNQRNLGLSAKPQVLELDLEKRTARLGVAVIGAVSYPQAVVELKNPALKESK